MELAIFFTVFAVLVFVVAPLARVEDRPGFRRPDSKPRPAVGSWFRDR